MDIDFEVSKISLHSLPHQHSQTHKLVVQLMCERSKDGTQIECDI